MFGRENVMAVDSADLKSKPRETIEVRGVSVRLSCWQILRAGVVLFSVDARGALTFDWAFPGCCRLLHAVRRCFHVIGLEW